MKWVESFEFYIYNKKMFTLSPKDKDFPILKIGLFGPKIVPFSIKTDEWNEAVRETKINFPFHVELYRTDVHFHYSMAFFFGFYVNYQWGY